jgi:hypothetical protein
MKGSAEGVLYMSFLRGFRQNLDEFRVWRKTKASFLTPTYLTLGIMNIQKFQKGEDLSSDFDKGDWPEINKLLRKMSEVTKGLVYTIDPHCFNPANFKRTPDGYMMVDYGQGSCGDFKGFILKWHKEITAVLCQPPG